MNEKNHFDKLIKQQTERKSQAVKDASLIQQNLISSSTDFRGNTLDDFFDSEDVELCRDFLESMKRRSYPRAHKIQLKTLKSKRLLTQGEIVLGPWSPSFLKRVRNKPLWTQLWTGQGYFIGVIKKDSKLFMPSSGSSSVYLCIDGRLRCERNKPIFNEETTKAYGYGSIPEASLLHGLKFSVGEFLGGPNSEIRTFQEVPLRAMLEKHVL